MNFHNLHILVGGKILSPRGAIFVPSPPPMPSYSIYMIALERDPCSKIVFTGKIIFVDFITLLDTNVRVMHSGDTSRGDTGRLS